MFVISHQLEFFNPKGWDHLYKSKGQSGKPLSSPPYGYKKSEIMHELIEKIVVYAPDKSSGQRKKKIEIHFRFHVAMSIAVADSMDYNKKRKAA